MAHVRATVELTHAACLAMAQAAITKAAENGQPQCIVIVGASDVTLLDLRMTGAKFLPLKSAHDGFDRRVDPRRKHQYLTGRPTIYRNGDGQRRDRIARRVAHYYGWAMSGRHWDRLEIRRARHCGGDSRPWRNRRRNIVNFEG